MSILQETTKILLYCGNTDVMLVCTKVLQQVSFFFYFAMLFIPIRTQCSVLQWESQVSALIADWTTNEVYLPTCLLRLWITSMPCDRWTTCSFSHQSHLRCFRTEKNPNSSNTWVIIMGSTALFQAFKWYARLQYPNRKKSLRSLQNCLVMFK